jgi:hypothetical protein
MLHCVSKIVNLILGLSKLLTKAKSMEAKCLFHKAVKLHHSLERAGRDDSIVVCHCGFDFFA